MSLWDLIQLAQQRQAAMATPQPPQGQGGSFMEGLLDGSYSGAPMGFNPTYPNVMGMEGNKYYPEFRFGYSGTPALNRLGVTQGGGMPPGMAMQVAQSQYFAPGSQTGQYLGARNQPAPQAAPEQVLPDILKPIGPRWRGSPDNYASYDDYVNAGYYMTNR